MARFTLRVYLRSLLFVILLEGIVTADALTLPGWWKLMCIPNIAIGYALWRIYADFTRSVKAGTRHLDWTPFK